MDSYKTIEHRLAKLEPFRGNSMTGKWEDRFFRVYSYSTLIAEWPLIEGITGEVRFDGRRYSVTTSRHQNLIKKAWGL